MQEIYVKYQIGEKCFTKDFPVTNPVPILKQLRLSLPLITGATIKLPLKENINILIGKEINLDKISLEKYKIEKYDLNLDQLADLSLKGYKKACLLSFKKYDQIIIGVKEQDIVVADYFSLKRIVDALALPYKAKMSN